MNLFLSRIVFNLRSQEARSDIADAYKMHQRIMSCFPAVPDADGDARRRLGVLYRLEPTIDEAGGERLTALVQSRLAPDLGKLPLNYAASRRTTEFTLSPRPGQVLRFRLRANPSRRLSRGSKDKTGNPVPPEDVGKRVPIRDADRRAHWLVQQGNRSPAAFSIVELKPTWGATGRAEDRALELLDIDTPRVRGNRHGHRVTIEGILFEGLLRVASPDALAQRVAEGIGPGKAFGFGLLSLARC